MGSKKSVTEFSATVMTHWTYQKQRLNRFHNRHEGERLILVCNGPSLNQTDFSLIRGEVSMGLNKIHLGLKRLHFYPRYYIAINQRVIQQSAEEIKDLNCTRFLRDLGESNPLKESALTYIVPSNPERKFHGDIREGFFEGFTVTFAALQFAYYMGFSTVAIVGMDHRYKFEGLPNEARKLRGPDTNHFDAGYFSGQKWDNPDLASSELYYSMARNAYEQAGRRIVDCTINGACNVFEKGELQQEVIAKPTRLGRQI